MKVSNHKKLVFLKLYIKEFLKAYDNHNLTIKLYFLWSIVTYIPILAKPFQSMSSILLGYRYKFTLLFFKKKSQRKERNLEFVYINLNKRLDRKVHMEKQFADLGLTEYKRFDAIENSNGMLGCLLSHKEVVTNWNNESDSLLVIMEDDISFNIDLENLTKIIHQFDDNPYLDVLTLGSKRFTSFKLDKTFLLTDSTVGTHFYVLKPYMKDKLLENFEFSELMLNKGITNKLAGIDVVWKKLQFRSFFASTIVNYIDNIDSRSDITIA